MRAAFGICIVILALALTSCGPAMSTPTRTPTPELPTPTPSPTLDDYYVGATQGMATVIAMRTLAKLPTLTQTPTATWNPTEIARATSARRTEQVWHATAISIQQTEGARSRQLRDEEATRVAQFPISCEDLDYPFGALSPNGQWLVTYCSTNESLVVQDSDGKRWILDSLDFLPDTLRGEPGFPIYLHQKFWSADGGYLYFASELGYSGGGNQCFPGGGDYGLFRLNLKTGSWVTLLPPTDGFPGKEIDFAPTGRRYAIATLGLLIEDLKTGQSIHVDTPFVQEMSWSPDGLHLAYSVASCGDQLVETSTAYVWDAQTGEVQPLLTVDGLLLRPANWIDNSTVRISGEKWVGLDNEYTIYDYDISQGQVILTGTATPNP